MTVLVWVFIPPSYEILSQLIILIRVTNLKWLAKFDHAFYFKNDIAPGCTHAQKEGENMHSEQEGKRERRVGGWMDVAIMVKRGRERGREMRAKSDSIKETF